jgi:tyrosinase
MTFVRRDVWTLAPDDPHIIAYGDAVATMQGRGEDDPTSWAAQAAIHGTYLDPPPPLADECKHGSWFFLPWHRMYLYWFERIVRAAVVANGGPADWALPYWNYDTTMTNTLPLAFRYPTRLDGTPNPLYVAPPDRGAGWNSGSLALPSWVTTAAFALSRPVYLGAPEFGGGTGPPDQQFWSATGRLEQTPHNDVHSTLGGWMGDPMTAAQDPIFWLHHANIDRLWTLWNGEGYTDPPDSDWQTQSFSFFDESGGDVSQQCSQVLDVEQLDYTYTVLRVPLRPPRWPVKRFPWPPWIKESIPVSRSPEALPPRVPGGPGPDPGPEIVGASEQPVELRGEAAQVPVSIDAKASGAVMRERGLTPEAQQATRMLLTVEDVEGDRNPNVVYGVYVNLPDDPSLEDLATHHAGNVSFFGIERIAQGGQRGDEHAHGLRFTMDITDLVASLRQRGAWQDGRLDVSFRPIRPLVVGDAPDLEAEIEATRHEHAPVTLGRVSVHMG